MQDTRYGRGFSILELLIALAITGLLLAAVAATFNASVKNYRENEGILKTLNSAGAALSRITTELRTAEWVDPSSPANECTLITAGGENITFRYSSSDNKLYLTDNSTGSDYVLCDNVTAMTFTKDTAIDDVGTTFVKSVQISMTLVSGNAERKVSAAAVVRRNLK